VISPEGCAAILWKDGNRCADAAAALKLTADDLSGLGLVDGILKEPEGGAHRDHEATFQRMREVLLKELDELCALPTDELLARRRRKFRFAGSIEGRFPQPAASY
jgi:acetyl-CoA carboxylase carboxyl transferase subunit alpha